MYAAALRSIFLHHLWPPLHAPKTGRPFLCMFLTKIRRFSVSFHGFPRVFPLKKDGVKDGDSFLACPTTTVFKTVAAKLQNNRHILSFRRVKCNFSSYPPARFYFCRMYLHFMQDFPAFCAKLSCIIRGFEIPLAFFVCRAYIVNREVIHLPILKRGACYVSHHRCLRHGIFGRNGLHDRQRHEGLTTVYRNTRYRGSKARYGRCSVSRLTLLTACPQCA